MVYAMTAREQQVVTLLLEGMDNEEIACQLGIAKRTVKMYMSSLFQHYGITNGAKRVKLAVMFYRHRLQVSSLSANGDCYLWSQPGSRISSLPSGSASPCLR
jgi:DNA-binding CsgD family transcriptional regulator